MGFLTEKPAVQTLWGPDTDLDRGKGITPDFECWQPNERQFKVVGSPGRNEAPMSLSAHSDCDRKRVPP